MSTSRPSRFRGDAASFSPSQNHHSYQPYPQQQQPNQQPQQVPLHQPIPVQYLTPQQQQQMYMQYAQSYPMMINPMYAPPPLYVPMYPQDMYYQQPAYPIPQQPHLQPSTIPYSPTYQQRKPINNKRTQSYNKFASPIKSSTNTIKEPESSTATTPSPVVKQDEITPTATSTSICTSPSLSTPEATPVKINTDNTTNDYEEIDNNDTNEIKYPLCINTTYDEFTNMYGFTKETRLVSDIEKSNRLRVVFEHIHDRLIINTNLMKIIDYNNNTTVVTNGRLQDSGDQKLQAKETTTIPAEEKSTPVPTTSNWASFLQTSARPVPNGTSTKKHTKSKSITKPIPKPASPVAPTPDFNINSESSQPLGILLLRIMFDPNYSVLNSQLPLFNTKPRGLANTGNICYMNSILQILLYCEPFNRLLKLIHDKSIGNLGASPTPMLDATIKLFNQFKPDEESKTPISPDEFYNSLTAQPKFSHLKWGQQEDAEEFLGYYLDGLNEEFLGILKKLNTPMIDSLIQHYSLENDVETVNKFKYNVKTTMKKVRNESKEENDESEDDDDDEGEWNEVGPKKKIHVKRTVEVEPTPLNMIFGGQFKSVLTIPKSTNSFQKSITFDPFQHVQLDISEASTIEGALEHLNKVEAISYKSSNKEIQIKKQTFLDKLPPVLIIHLKRFSYSNQDVAIEKLKKKIDYNHDLIIPKDVLSTSAEIKYRLTSVVYHHGSSADAGHYTTDVFKSDDSQWWRIDDANFKEISTDDVQNHGGDDIKNAYILLYKKV